MASAAEQMAANLSWGTLGKATELATVFSSLLVY